MVFCIKISIQNHFNLDLKIYKDCIAVILPTAGVLHVVKDVLTEHSLENLARSISNIPSLIKLLFSKDGLYHMDFKQMMGGQDIVSKVKTPEPIIYDKPMISAMNESGNAHLKRPANSPPEHGGRPKRQGEIGRALPDKPGQAMKDTLDHMDQHDINEADVKECKAIDGYLKTMDAQNNSSSQPRTGIYQQDNAGQLVVQGHNNIHMQNNPTLQGNVQIPDRPRLDTEGYRIGLNTPYLQGYIDWTIAENRDLTKHSWGLGRNGIYRGPLGPLMPDASTNPDHKYNTQVDKHQPLIGNWGYAIEHESVKGAWKIGIRNSFFDRYQEKYLAEWLVSHRDIPSIHILCDKLDISNKDDRPRWSRCRTSDIRKIVDAFKRAK